MARNFDEVMSRYHSKYIVEKFKSHNTPDKVRNQMLWKEIYVVEDDGEVVATGALANFGDAENPKYSSKRASMRILSAMILLAD